jgi:hypothetical protein
MTIFYFIASLYRSSRLKVSLSVGTFALALAVVAAGACSMDNASNSGTGGRTGSGGAAGNGAGGRGTGGAPGSGGIVGPGDGGAPGAGGGGGMIAGSGGHVITGSGGSEPPTISSCSGTPVSGRPLCTQALSCPSQQTVTCCGQTVSGTICSCSAFSFLTCQSNPVCATCADAGTDTATDVKAAIDSTAG